MRNVPWIDVEFRRGLSANVPERRCQDYWHLAAIMGLHGVSNDKLEVSLGMSGPRSWKATPKVLFSSGSSTDTSHSED
jgi:hypothetical protein